MPARARTEIQFSRAPRIRLLLSKRLNRRTIPWSWNVLSYIRRMMQKFLTFRASPIVPLGRLPDEIQNCGAAFQKSIQNSQMLFLNSVAFVCPPQF